VPVQHEDERRLPRKTIVAACNPPTKEMRVVDPKFPSEPYHDHQIVQANIDMLADEAA
jgi:hypothetical protein